MTKETTFEKIELVDKDKVSIFPGATVKKSTQGNIVEITYTSHRVQGATIRKLNDKEYEVVSTGEVKEYNKDKQGNRTDNTKELKRSFEKLRAIINTNVVDTNTVRWCTFTYRENMQDSKRVVKDWGAFWKRFKRRFGNNIDYIIALEPQERGAWHIHAIILFHNKAPYISGYELGEIWQQGFCNVQALDNVDNVGAYLTAYLTDIEVNDNEEYDKTVDNKKIKKGGRLKYYPTKFHFYRTSKGVKRPTEEDAMYGDLQELNKCSQTYKKAFNIRYDENDQNKKITIIKEYYNLKRPRQDGDKHYIPKHKTMLEKRNEILEEANYWGFGDIENDICAEFFGDIITPTEIESYF